MVLEPLESEPLVSILTANYNYARYLPEAIESALGQTYRNIEIIVCDDGSSDDSCAVVRRYAADDQRVQLIEKENGGYPTAVNAAYERSRGRVICILDSDDVFKPTKVQEVLDALRDGSGLSCHRLEPVDEESAPIGPPLPQVLDSGWLGDVALERGGEGHFAPASGLSLRREVADVLFPLPLIFRRRGADGYIARASQFVTRVAASPAALTLYRIHGTNTTGLWSADEDSLRGFIDDNVKITAACRDFLRRVYDNDVAERLRDEERPSYWEARLGLRIVAPESPEAKGLTASGLKDKVPSSKRRIVWTVLLALPRPLSRRLLAFWWGSSSVKGALVRAAGRARGLARRRPKAPARPAVNRSFEPMALPPLSDRPLASVLIANYNYGSFLSDSVGSALAQTYDDVEIVVCDDGSTDHSIEILERMASSHPSIRVLRQSNKGQAAALSNAFAGSRGEIVTLLDADDFMAPQKIQRVVETFQERPDAGMVVHQMIRVDEHKKEQGVYPTGSPLPDGWLGPQAFAAGGYVPWIEAGIMSLRREVAERIFPLPEDAGQFADVILRGAGAMLAPVAAVEEPLAYYRLHGSNAGNTARSFELDEMLRRRRRDLEEVRAAYEGLQRWLVQEHPGAALPAFERTRPFLERRYVIARLALEPAADRKLLLSRLLELRESLSPTLRAFYRISPWLPRRVFKAGLETVYGQGTIKASLARTMSRLGRNRRTEPTDVSAG